MAFLQSRRDSLHPPSPKGFASESQFLTDFASVRGRGGKLSYTENAELAALPDRIDALEQERSALYESMSDPAFTRDPDALLGAKRRLDALEVEITTLTERWESLETISGS